MHGTINGHKMTVAGYVLRPWEIEVHYESGVGDFSLHQQSLTTKVITTREAVYTSDAEFDRRYQLFSHNLEATAAFVSWLTPTRRSVLFALDDAFVITNLDEDELVVRLHSASPTVQELRAAIDTCVWAAEAFDSSAP